MIQAKKDHELIKKGEEGQMITNIPNDRTSDY